MIKAKKGKNIGVIKLGNIMLTLFKKQQSPRWEYQIKVISVKAGEDDLGDFIRALNPAGDKGWEHYDSVHVDDDVILFFKRQL